MHERLVLLVEHLHLPVVDDVVARRQRVLRQPLLEAAPPRRPARRPSPRLRVDGDLPLAVVALDDARGRRAARRRATSVTGRRPCGGEDLERRSAPAWRGPSPPGAPRWASRRRPRAACPPRLPLMRQAQLHGQRRGGQVHVVGARAVDGDLQLGLGRVGVARARRPCRECRAASSRTRSAWPLARSARSGPVTRTMMGKKSPRALDDGRVDQRHLGGGQRRDRAAARVSSLMACRPRSRARFVRRAARAGAPCSRRRCSPTTL